MALIPPVDREAVLARHFLFQKIDAHDLAQVASHAWTARVPARKVIFRQGCDTASLVAVLSGRVRICSYSAEGKEITLNIIGPGGFFGEIALLDGKPRTAEAIALDPCELLFLERKHFVPWLQQQPDACLQIMAVLCARLRQTSLQLEDSIFHEVPVRLAKALRRLIDAFGEPSREGVRVTLKLSQQQLGSLVGITRESTNKYLNEWQRLGLLSVESGYITVHDTEHLNRIADVGD